MSHLLLVCNVILALTETDPCSLCVVTTPPTGCQVTIHTRASNLMCGLSTLKAVQLLSSDLYVSDSENIGCVLSCHKERQTPILKFLHFLSNTKCLPQMSFIRSIFLYRKLSSLAKIGDLHIEEREFSYCLHLTEFHTGLCTLSTAGLVYI